MARQIYPWRFTCCFTSCFTLHKVCTSMTCPPGHASSLLQQAAATTTDVSCAAVLHTDGKGESLQPEPKKKKRLSTKEDIKARMAAEAMDMLASGDPMSDSVRHSGAASLKSAISWFHQLRSAPSGVWALSLLMGHGVNHPLCRPLCLWPCRVSPQVMSTAGTLVPPWLCSMCYELRDYGCTQLHPPGSRRH